MSADAETTTLKDRVEAMIAKEIRPLLQRDGGDIEILDVQDSVVRVRLQGTCSGCPTTVMSVVMGIEQELRRHLPEVEYLEAAP
jgi:Fe-S cluster biogenesis protein NfuA